MGLTITFMGLAITLVYKGIFMFYYTPTQLGNG